MDGLLSVLSLSGLAFFLAGISIGVVIANYYHRNAKTPSPATFKFRAELIGLGQDSVKSVVRTRLKKIGKLLDACLKEVDGHLVEEKEPCSAYSGPPMDGSELTDMQRRMLHEGEVGP